MYHGMYTQNITVIGRTDFPAGPILPKCDCIYFFIPGQNFTTVTKGHTLRQRKIKYMSHPDCDVMRVESLHKAVSSFLQSLVVILSCLHSAASTATVGPWPCGGPPGSPGPSHAPAAVRCLQMHWFKSTTHYRCISCSFPKYLPRMCG